MKMKYVGYRVSIDMLDGKLKDALMVSEIIKGFKKEGIEVEIETKRLTTDEDDIDRSIDGVIFKVSLPKKKADKMSKLIPFNFFTYASKRAIPDSDLVPEDGSYDGSGTITLIYPLEYNTSDLLRDLDTIKSLDIRGEKFYPLATVENYDEVWDSIRTTDCEMINYTISYIIDPEEWAI